MFAIYEATVQVSWTGNSKGTLPRTSGWLLPLNWLLATIRLPDLCCTSVCLFVIRRFLDRITNSNPPIAIESCCFSPPPSLSSLTRVTFSAERFLFAQRREFKDQELWWEVSCMPSCCCRMLLSRRLPYFMMRMWVLKDFTSSCYFPLYRKYMHNYRIINIIIFTTNFTSVCPALWRDPLFRYGGTTSGALWAIFLGFQDSGKSCRCCRG